MAAAVLTIGTELTRGEIVDTNAAWLSERLTALGIDVVRMCTVDDDDDRIVEALRRSSEGAGVVLVTGGLGPTSDDRTAACAARAAGVACVRDPQSVAAIERRLATLGRTPTASVLRQADMPVGAHVLGNPVGTAPAFALAIGGTRFFFMPGVPGEMTTIFEQLVVPQLGPLASPDSYQLVLRTYGMPESAIGEALADLPSRFERLTLGYRVSYPEVLVKLHVRMGDLLASRVAAQAAAAEVEARLGRFVHGHGEDSLATAVGRALRSRAWSLTVAESCTGGLVGSLLTQVPGSSEYFLFDAVTYSNGAKEGVLSVPGEVLRTHGAVSAECARAMAEGLRRTMPSNMGLAITGIAGPGGGTAEKPVGLVYFAVATDHGTALHRQVFSGERTRIQRGAAFFGLDLVRRACEIPSPTT